MAQPQGLVDWHKLFAELAEERRRDVEQNPGVFHRQFMQDTRAPRGSDVFHWRKDGSVLVDDPRADEVVDMTDFRHVPEWWKIWP